MILKRTLLSTALISFTFTHAACGTSELDLDFSQANPSTPVSVALPFTEKCAYTKSYQIWLSRLKMENYEKLEKLHAQLEQANSMPAEWRQRYLRVLVVGTFLGKDHRNLHRYRSEMLESESIEENYFINLLIYATQKDDPEKFKKGWDIFQNVLQDLSPERKETFYAETTLLAGLLYGRFPEIIRRLEEMDRIYENAASLPLLERREHDPLAFYQTKSQEAHNRYNELNSLRPLHKEEDKAELIRLAITGPIYSFLAKDHAIFFKWTERFLSPLFDYSVPSYVYRGKYFLFLLERMHIWASLPLSKSLEARFSLLHEQESTLSVEFLEYVKQIHTESLKFSSPDQLLRKSALESALCEKKEEMSTLLISLFDTHSLANQFISLLIMAASMAHLEIISLKPRFLSLTLRRNSLNDVQRTYLDEETKPLEAEINTYCPGAKYRMQALAISLPELSDSLLDFLDYRSSLKNSLNERIVLLKKEASINSILILQALYCWLERTKEAKELEQLIQRFNQSNDVDLLKMMADMSLLIRKTQEHIVDPFKEEQDEYFKKSYTEVIDTFGSPVNPPAVKTKKIKKNKKRTPVFSSKLYDSSVVVKACEKAPATQKLAAAPPQREVISTPPPLSQELTAPDTPLLANSKLELIMKPIQLQSTLFQETERSISSVSPKSVIDAPVQSALVKKSMALLERNEEEYNLHYPDTLRRASLGKVSVSEPKISPEHLILDTLKCTKLTTLASTPTSLELFEGMPHSKKALLEDGPPPLLLPAPGMEIAKDTISTQNLVTPASLQKDVKPKDSSARQELPSKIYTQNTVEKIYPASPLHPLADGAVLVENHSSLKNKAPLAQQLPGKIKCTDLTNLVSACSSLELENTHSKQALLKEHPAQLTSCVQSQAGEYSINRFPMTVLPAQKWMHGVVIENGTSYPCKLYEEFSNPRNLSQLHKSAAFAGSFGYMSPLRGFTHVTRSLIDPATWHAVLSYDQIMGSHHLYKSQHIRGKFASMPFPQDREQNNDHLLCKQEWLVPVINPPTEQGMWVPVLPYEVLIKGVNFPASSRDPLLTGTFGYVSLITNAFVVVIKEP